MSGHPPGTILVITGDLARFAAFSMALMSLERPYNTSVCWVTEGDLAKNLNVGITRMRGEWVWILGDDHVFAPDLLLHLLDRQVDMVSPLCFQRKPPFLPLVYRKEDADGRFCYWPPAELPPSGCVQCAGTSGLLLVRRRVFEALGAPWFRMGELDGVRPSEDLGFQRRAKQAGFTIHTDLDHWIGHTGPGTVWPRRDETGWTVAIDMLNQVPGITTQVDEEAPQYAPR